MGDLCFIASKYQKAVDGFQLVIEAQQEILMIPGFVVGEARKTHEAIIRDLEKAQSHSAKQLGETVKALNAWEQRMKENR